MSPSALVLRAALTSRSCIAPHVGQVHSRMAKERDSSSWPQTEHRLELGYQRLIATSVRPYHLALYRTVRTVPADIGDGFRQAVIFQQMNSTANDSTQTTWFSRMSLVVSWCWKSRRRSAMRAWRRATRSPSFLSVQRLACCFLAWPPLQGGQALLLLGEEVLVADFLPGRERHHIVQPQVQRPQPWTREASGV